MFLGVWGGSWSKPIKHKNYCNVLSDFFIGSQQQHLAAIFAGLQTLDKTPGARKKVLTKNFQLQICIIIKLKSVKIITV